MRASVQGSGKGSREKNGSALVEQKVYFVAIMKSFHCCADVNETLVENGVLTVSMTFLTTPPTSHCSSGSSRSKATSASSAPVSMSMTSPVNSSSVGKQKQKKQCLDVQSKVDMLNAEIENAQSDKITQEELKNELYMVKYNLAWQVNEHKFLKHKHADDHTEAAAAHICGLEAKNSEIHLCEAEVKMHDALVHAHKEEATTLRLKIEYARLMGSNSGS
ncbi:hypothetical protein BDR07DRAFT_1484800 [Suillus spraguei]|nr:hypothetical protein BDR07DRAFT_1484800 [Suillus spraguei]